MGKKTKLRVFVIYSALHTGTWFAVKSLWFKRCMGHLVDAHFLDSFGVHFENCPFVNSLGNGFHKQIETLSRNVFHSSPFIYDDGITIQAHHRQDNSSFLHTLIKSPASVPVIIPMRDPLLALNTRIWRECQSFEVFSRRSNEDRVLVCKDQLMSMKNLLVRIPKSHVFVFPIDLDTDYASRYKRLESLYAYCGLNFLNIESYVFGWEPVNPTDGEYIEHTSGDRFFKDMKRAIVNKDTKTIQEAYHIEWDLLCQEQELRQSMIELGYRPIW